MKTVNKKIYLISTGQTDDSVQYITYLKITKSTDTEKRCKGVDVAIGYTTTNESIFNLLISSKILYFTSRSAAENVLKIIRDEGYSTMTIAEVSFDITINNN